MHITPPILFQLHRCSIIIVYHPIRLSQDREVDKVVDKLRYLKIDETLINKYVRVMVTGCPNHFVAETTRANALLHWSMQNGPTINKKLDQVLKTMNKEDKNNFVIPIPHWLARFHTQLVLHATAHS
eukprot:scaffold64035_cov53-Cyclotella_meneghiniana.AAC.1